jgi:hypothetical protein
MRLYGAYAHEPKRLEAPHPAYGHSKEGRDDLKHVRLSLGVSGDGGLPLRVGLRDGNRCRSGQHGVCGPGAGPAGTPPTPLAVSGGPLSRRGSDPPHAAGAAGPSRADGPAPDGGGRPPGGGSGGAHHPGGGPWGDGPGHDAVPTEAWADAELLHASQAQHTPVDPGCRWSKPPAALAPGWLEPPDRLAAVARLPVRGLLGSSVLQSQGRLSLRRHDPQLPGNTGRTAIPTAAVVVALCAHIALGQ